MIILYLSAASDMCHGFFCLVKSHFFQYIHIYIYVYLYVYIYIYMYICIYCHGSNVKIWTADFSHFS